MALRSVYVDLALRVRGWQAGIATSRQGLRDLSGELDKLRKNNKQQFDEMGRHATVVGVGLVAAFGLAANAARNFDKEMSAVGAAADTNAESLERLRVAALAAGKATQYSATEAARAEEELAKAGVSVNDILSGGLVGALNLAAAGQMDLADAATIAAQAMNVFHLSGSSVPHIADVLAAAANKSAAGMSDLSDALKQGGNVAAAAGLSLEETTGVLAAFADRALVGSDAGTSLKSMLLALEAPSQKSAELMSQLGIKIYDAQGNFIGVTKLAGVLQKQLGTLTQAERNHALATIFGSDATRAATVLYGLGEDGLRSYVDAVNDAGAASRSAAAKMDNWNGDLERLQGSLETLTTQAGEGVTPALRLMTQGASGFVDRLNDMNPVVAGAVTGLAGLSGAALLGIVGWMKARNAINDFREALDGMGPAGKRASAMLGTTAKWATRAGVAFAALEVVNTVAGFFKPAAADTEQLALSLEHLANAGEATGEATRLFGSDLKDVEGLLKSAWNNDAAGKVADGLEGLKKAASFEPGFLSGFDWSMQSKLDRMQALDAALASMASDGHGREAAQTFELIRQKADALGIPIDQLRMMFPEYTTALDNAKAATDSTAQSQKLAADRATILSGTFQDLVTDAGSVKAAFDKMNGAALDWASAEDDMEAAFDAADKAIKENGKTLDVHTEKGRNNRKALEEIATSTRDAMQARVTETKNLQDAIPIYEHGREEFIKNAIAAGLTKKAAAELADQWLKIPTAVSTQVNTPGMNTVLHNMQVLKDFLDHLPWHKDVTIGFKSAERAAGNRWGGMYEHAAVGTLREAGTYSASNPGRYMIAEPETGGEAFIPRKGNYGRSMSILNGAAGWYGAQVVPRMSPAAATPSVVNVYVTVDPITGKTTRRMSIDEAKGRGVPDSAIAAAYP